MYFGTDNIHLTDHINLHSVYWLVIVDGWYWWFSSELNICIKIQCSNHHWCKNQEPVEMNLCAFSAAQEVCSKLKNQAKCDSAVFKTIQLKSYYFLHFLIAEKTLIIPRTNYKWLIGKGTQPDKLWVWVLPMLSYRRWHQNVWWKMTSTLTNWRHTRGILMKLTYCALIPIVTNEKTSSQRANFLSGLQQCVPKFWQ